MLNRKKINSYALIEASKGASHIEDVVKNLPGVLEQTFGAILVQPVFEPDDIGDTYTYIKQKALRVSTSRTDTFNDYCRGILKCVPSVKITRHFDEDQLTKKILNLKTGTFMLSIVYKFYDTRQDISLIKLKHPELYDYLIKDIRSTENPNKREYFIHTFFIYRMEHDE